MGVHAGGGPKRGDTLAHNQHREGAADDAGDGGDGEHDGHSENAVADRAIAGQVAGGLAVVCTVERHSEREASCRWLVGAGRAGCVRLEASSTGLLCRSM